MLTPTETVLQRSIDHTSLVNGRAYVNSSRVQFWELSENRHKLTALVQGTVLYKVEAALTWSSAGVLTGLTGFCSCAQAYQCKHLAAAMYAAHAAGALRQDVNQFTRTKWSRPDFDSDSAHAIQEPLDPDLGVWLTDYQRHYEPLLRDQAKAADPNAYAPKVKDRIWYVFDQEGDALTIVPMKVSVRKDGSLTRGSAQPYDFHHVKHDRPPRFIRPIDLRIFRLLSVMPRHHHYWDRRAVSDDDEGQMLFRLVLETARAYWEHEGGLALYQGDPYTGEIAWRDFGGTQRLEVKVNQQTDDSGSKDRHQDEDYWVKPLPLVPPWYLDTESGRCGPLQTELSALKIKWLAGAPPVPATQTEQVITALLRANVDIPLPRPVAQERITEIEPVPVLTLGAVKARERDNRSASAAYYRPFQRHDIAPRLRLSYDYDGLRVAGDAPDTITRCHANGNLQVIERNAALEDALWRQLVDCVGDYHFLGASQHKNQAEFGNYTDHDLVFWPFDGQAPMTPTGGGYRVLDFIADVLPALKAQGWIVVVDRTWPCPLHEGEGQIHGGIEQDEDSWFSLGLNFDINGQTFDLLPVLADMVELIPEDILEDDRKLDAMIDSSKVVVRFKDGHYARVPIAPLVPALRFIRDINQRMHAAESGRIHSLAEALAGCGIAFDGGDQLQELGKRLSLLMQVGQGADANLGAEGHARLPQIPDTFKGDLRPYQQTGTAWMLALTDTGFGGVLADDMGLGKTVQTLAFLATRQHAFEQGQAQRPLVSEALPAAKPTKRKATKTAQSKTNKTAKASRAASANRTANASVTPSTAETRLPCLLVVPTSLVSNWQREAARFVPDMRVLALHGPDRKQHFDAISQQDLVITTYPLLHRDHEALFAQDYDTVILDEAQNVKNPTSQAAKLIRDVSARQRLALTGTPMENNLEELWCIFDWLIPGLLGNRKSFNETFRKPIEKDNDLKRRVMLSKRIAPFVMRRTKDQVVTDLPPRTEIVESVQLMGTQHALYETVRATMHERVRKALSNKGLAASKITVLDALLKLRQACCDPRLVKLASAESISESAKRNRLMEILESLTLEGRRVLVFSQFVEMLRLIESDIKAQGWDYLMLTGQSKKRGDLVDAFQSGKANIFLISLKAGGVGLNLTAADTVILYDPWWNPAIERQAMDRAHRIGQDKPVFVHRLIAEGTVETRIAEMQARKQALMDSVFDPEATGAMEMSEDDILSLFAPIGD
jgi:superfamily II DNA or RNA helicase